MFTRLGFFALFLISLSSFADSPKIALILDRGGKDDKSFNTAAFKGATEAKQKLGVFLKEIEVADDNMYEPAMKSFAQKKFDLIVAVGISQLEAVKKLAKELPNQKFAIVDAKVEAPNVASLMFEEQEGSYLVGYVAGMKTKSDKVGFIGGMDIPLIRRFEMAFMQGAKAARPTVKTVTNYIGVTGEAWNNPTKAKELAVAQYGQGADVIFTAAGASNNGVFDAAESGKKYVIGCDSNQNWIKPGLVLTSMLKRVDTAVFNVIADVSKGQFKGGVHVFGLKNQGIDWAFDENNRKLFTEAEQKKIAQLKSDIVAGKVKIDDYYKKK